MHKYRKNIQNLKQEYSSARRVWATAQRSDPPEKKPCATHARWVGRSSNKYSSK